MKSKKEEAEMKVLRGTPKHISQSGQLTGFVYLMLTLPFKCNYRCPKCFNLDDNEPRRSMGEAITLQEVLDKINEACDLGGRVVVIAGEGEPTLDEDIRTIVERIDRLRMTPIIYSNASVLNPEIVEFYRDRNVCLVIALDSLNPEIYQFLTGTRSGMLSRVLRNLECLRRVYTDTIRISDDVSIVRLALNMTLCSRNQGEVEEIKRFAGDDMYFICNPLARLGNAVGNWQGLIDSEQDFEAHHRLIRQHSESGGPLTLDSAGICGYSINGISIGPFGHYMTCAYTQLTDGLLGAIRDRTLQQAYQLKAKMERQHYQKQGAMPCLVRDPSFDEYLAKLGSLVAIQPARR